MPTVWSAGRVPAYTLRMSQAGNLPALRTRKRECPGWGGIFLEARAGDGTVLAACGKERIFEFMSSPKSTPEKTATCPECGSADIVKSIGIAKMTEAGSIGLGHNTDYFVKATEPLVVDLCRNCGTVVRLYVKKADKRWTTV